MSNLSMTHDHVHEPPKSHVHFTACVQHLPVSSLHQSKAVARAASHRLHSDVLITFLNITKAFFFVNNAILLKPPYYTRDSF